LRGSEALLFSAFVFRIRVCSSLLTAAAVFGRFFAFFLVLFVVGFFFFFFFFFWFGYGVVGCGGKAPSDTSAGIK
jgi:hypothetical protein